MLGGGTIVGEADKRQDEMGEVGCEQRSESSIYRLVDQCQQNKN